MLRFDGCELDVAGRELRRDGVPVHLEPQAFDLLVHLVRERSRVVPKHDLLDGVWGHRFVSEAALTTRIKEIRRAVGDDGRTQRTIRNVRGRGYRFVAEVSEVAEVAHDPQATAASRSASTTIGPAGDGGIVGREVVLAELRATVRERSVVTLVGPGGVGKSTLARRLVAEFGADALGDGVALVELATIDDPDQVLATVAQATEVVLDTERPSRTVQAIAQLDALLVLDNCEHVVDGVLDLLDRCRAVPGAALRVLATSQVRLGVSDEVVVTVEPLELEAAVDLFLRRADAARRAWRRDGLDRARVVALVEHLDRLPLTIEMAAARLGSMTFDELERAVDEGGRLLQVTHRTPARRHRTLASLVAWSTDLLDDEQRRTLEEVSVFAGAATAADLGAVLRPEDPAAVAATLALLADRSLLAVDLDGPVATYRMLETVRLVSAERLARRNGAGDARRRHARHVVEIVREVDRRLRTSEELTGRTRLAASLPEVRAAHRWAIANDPVTASAIGAGLHLAAYGSLWNEPASWAAALLETRPDAAPADLLGARIVLGGAAANAGRLDEAVAQLDVVLASAEDLRWRAIALEILCDVAIYAGRLDDALERCEELRQLAVEIGDRHLQVLSVVNSSLALTYGEAPAEARRRLGTVDRTGLSPTLLAWLSYASAEERSESGDAQQASTDVDEALFHARRVGNSFVESVSLQLASTIQIRSGHEEGALDSSSACLRAHARHGNLVHAVTTLRNVVELFVRLGDDAVAAVLVGATKRGELRSSYGTEAERLDSTVAGLAARMGGDRFDEAMQRGDALDLMSAVRFALEAVEVHRARRPHPVPRHPQTVLRRSTSRQRPGEVG